MVRSRELETLVAAWFDAASRGDGSLVDRHVSGSDDARLIGSDPAEWLRGGTAIAEFLRGEVTGAGGTVRFTPSEVEAQQEGTVGWATAKLLIRLPDGRHVSPRWSAVLHLEDGVWKFVQTHASIGITNENVGWTYAR